MNWIRQSYLSVTDFETYLAVADQSPWRSLAYFMAWIAVAALFTASTLLVRFYPVASSVGDWLIQNLPRMEVRQGRLSTAAPAPYRLSLRNPNLRIVVDPTDMVRKASQTEGIEVIFNSNRIYFQVQGREDSYAFRNEDNFKIDPATLSAMRRVIRIFFFPFSLILLLPYYTLTKALQICFLALCGRLLQISETSGLAWRQWANLAVYALTPALLIGMIFQLTTVSVSVAWFFYITTALLYTVLAGRRCMQARNQRHTSDSH